MLEAIGWVSSSGPVRRTAHALAQLAAFSLSPRLSHQFGPRFAAWLTANTEHLPCGKNSPAYRGRGGGRSTDAKTEKMALLRYGLIAPLVSETLPRGEVMQRARAIAARHYVIPGSHGLRFPSIACCTGPGVTARVVSKPWLPSLGRIVEPFALLPRSWPS
jgi:hypothetical protein